MRLTLLLMLSACLAAGWLQAFPPAPFYTLYGTVRDQVGQSINADNSYIVLLKGNVEIGRTLISSDTQLDQNYEMRIRIDQNRGGTTMYSDSAIVAQGAFSLLVELNGEKFYPIEVAGTLTAGKGGRTRAAGPESGRGPGSRRPA